MRILVHADDLGISRGITDAILRCADEGALNSTSVVVNCAASGYALAEWRKRPGLRLALHLNLVEGRPLSPPGALDLLTDEDGFFCHTFLSLWKLWRLSGAAKRVRLVHQIKQEFTAQIEAFRRASGDDAALAIDSHRHIHLIPFVFESLLDLSKNHPISTIRLVNEPFFIGRSWLSQISLGGCVTHMLLNAHSCRQRGALEGHGISYPDYWIGALYSGQMTAPVVGGALEKIVSRAPSDDTTVEIVFHPGAGPDDDPNIWDRYPEYRNHYLSPWRQIEAECLKNPDLQDILDQAAASTNRTVRP